MKKWIKQAILYFIMSVVSTIVTLIAQNIVTKIEKMEYKMEKVIKDEL